jgi:succinylarginine dihydrolase
VPELQLDGLVGPTHNYAGLSPGNVASQANRAAVSHPRKAALQGLDKMRSVAALGVPQGFLPPHERPHMPTLHALGFAGADADVLAAALRDAPHLLARASSASAMWTANAATAIPSADASDAKLHLVVANLRAMPHRAIEHATTARLLRAAFPDRSRTSVHDPVDSGGDEGAANHIRLTRTADAGADAAGLHIFVYGTGDGTPPPKVHPARQDLAASRSVAALGILPESRTIFLRQDPDVIDAGCFHNDVCSVGNGHVLLMHERTFADGAHALDRIRDATGGALVPIVVSDAELPIAEAVSSYLFNSQVITRPDGGMTIVAPAECGEMPRVQRVLERITGGSTPIDSALLMDVRESMRNGGGPACLRLRVPLAGAESDLLHPGFRWTPERDAWLRAWVERWYPESLTLHDLADPSLPCRTRDALDALTSWIGAGPLYDFQLGGSR